MKPSLRSLFIAAVMPLLALTAFSQATTFTYQGFLTDNGAPANQRYDFIVTDFDAPTGGSSTTFNLVTNIGVTNGLFTLQLDLTALTFPGADRWLEISVRTNGTGGFTPLTPRQRVTSTPYAIRAASAGSVAASNLTGTLAPAQLPAAVVTNGASGITVTGTFTGNGAGLTNLNTWKLNGNSGTTAGPHFIGTSDNEPLVIKVDGDIAMRFEPGASGNPPNILGGRSANAAANTFSVTIGGGYYNDSDSSDVTIAGGTFNHIGSATGYETIGGGIQNRIEGGPTGVIITGGSVIAGGKNNSVGFNSGLSTISGGSSNIISSNSLASTISGGSGNSVGSNADFSTIGGGYDSTIADNGQYATIPGGRLNAATNYAFAAGRRAKAVHTGAFVWADSTDADFSSTVSNQFNIRATGGVRVSDNTPSLSFGTTTRQMLNLWSTNFALGVQDNTTYFRSLGRFSWFFGGSHTNTENNPGPGGSAGMTLTSGGLTVNGTFVSSSDRNVKEDFRPVNPAQVLDKVLGLPLQEWVYKTDAERSRHLGPMAQDFHAAFGLGPDDKHIATVDADGVALAAIQGLNQKTEDRSRTAEARIHKLETENAELKQRLGALEKLFNSLKAAQKGNP